MTFLKEGKTNWKYILIVVILAVIVGGGILGYLRYFKREMVSISQFPEIKKPEKIVKESEEELFSKLNKDDLLHKLFPLLNFQDERVKGELDYPGLRLFLKKSVLDHFINLDEKHLLLIAELEGVPHAGGLYHAFLGIFDKNGNLLTPSSCFPSCNFWDDKSHFGGDLGEFEFYDCLGLKYIVFASAGCPVGGCCDWRAVMLKFENGKFKEVQIIDRETLSKENISYFILAAAGPSSALKIILEKERIVIKMVPAVPATGECSETDFKTIYWHPDSCRFE